MTAGTEIPWPASVHRLVATGRADERTVLEAFLDAYRDVMVAKVVDLSDEDGRRRLVASHTTLTGLLKHLRVVEMNWFQRTLAQVPEQELPIPVVEGGGSPASFAVDPEERLDDVVAAYRAQCALSRQIAAARTLDEPAPHPELGEVALRWVLVHMIDETARHAGHADILREQLDGRVGP